VAQSSRAVRENAAYFAENAEQYAAWLATLDTYRLQAAVITRELAGSRRLVDIGNGGAFAYDASSVGDIVAVDLFAPEQSSPHNVRFVQGSALELPLTDASCDTVLIVMLLHHLVGDGRAELEQNARRALTEARRILEPGGRLILVESCLPRLFAAVEPLLVHPLAWLAATRGHPPTFQLSAATVARLVAETFGSCQAERMPMGRWVVQLGRRWPVALTPTRSWLFQASRPRDR
jgi:ubiquinone/menaquinone biosynthesis C-methylase UbiE